MLTRNGLLSTLVLILLVLNGGCNTVSVPDTEVCVVAGLMGAGADCSHTLADPPQTRSMNLEQFVYFLEPQEEKPDPDHPGVLIPARGAALCQSAEDWGKQKTALEQACLILGDRCTFELKTTLDTMTKNIGSLQDKIQVKNQELKEIGP